MQHSNRAVIFEFIGNRKRSHIFKRRFSISLYADATEMYSSDYNKHYLRPCHSTSASAAINRRLFVVDDVLESVAATPRSVATALVAPSGLLRYLYAARGFVDLPTTAETLQPPESPCPFKLTSRFSRQWQIKWTWGLRQEAGVCCRRYQVADGAWCIQVVTCSMSDKRRRSSLRLMDARRRELFVAGWLTLPASNLETHSAAIFSSPVQSSNPRSSKLHNDWLVRQSPRTPGNVSDAKRQWLAEWTELSSRVNFIQSQTRILEWRHSSSCCGSCLESAGFKANSLTSRIFQWWQWTLRYVFVKSVTVGSVNLSLTGYPH